jgi:hypothetical protein
VITVSRPYDADALDRADARRRKALRETRRRRVVCEVTQERVCGRGRARLNHRQEKILAARPEVVSAFALDHAEVFRPETVEGDGSGPADRLKVADFFRQQFLFFGAVLRRDGQG